MKAEEAIAYLACGAVPGCLCVHNKRHGGDCDGEECVNEAINIAISALEKQIQKKPRETRDSLLCATCGHKIMKKGGRKLNIKYCKKCGQKIDWGD